MKIFPAFFCAAVGVALSVPVQAKPVIGEPAPAIELRGADGRTHALSEYKGKLVVLEWHNPECPFVKKHYNAGNLPKQQADAVAAGTVWLTINSGAPGKHGVLDADSANAWQAANASAASAYLFDPTGSAGRDYAAKRRRTCTGSRNARCATRRHRLDRERDTDDIGSRRVLPQLIGEPLRASRQVKTSNPWLSSSTE